MPKKHTYSFIKKQFELEGYTLISEKYINALTKLEFICPKGHRHNITYGDFSQGRRCAFCAGVARLDYADVKNFFAAAGHRLLSTEYINSDTKLDYICSNGHKHSIRWNDYKKGYGCPICGKSKALRVGESHWNWQGGLSAQPYCLMWMDNEYKKSIKIRDKNICQNPYCYRIKYKKRLSIHHINYNKKDCVPKNLITLCTGCNNRANKDRGWHQEWYQLLLSKRFGYVYDK